jgi:ribulose-5-phosphate 4-epimerase/fuculose-1-phosphate aldolase
MKKWEGRYLYITPSGWRKTIMHPKHVVRLEIVDDPETGLRIPKINEQQKPSDELWMHSNLQRNSSAHEPWCMSTQRMWWKPSMPGLTYNGSTQSSQRFLATHI